MSENKINNLKALINRLFADDQERRDGLLQLMDLIKVGTDLGEVPIEPVITLIGVIRAKSKDRNDFTTAVEGCKVLAPDVVVEAVHI